MPMASEDISKDALAIIGRQHELSPFPARNVHRIDARDRECDDAFAVFLIATPLTSPDWIKSIPQWLQDSRAKDLGDYTHQPKFRGCDPSGLENCVLLGDSRDVSSITRGEKATPTNCGLAYLETSRKPYRESRVPLVQKLHILLRL